MSECNACQIVSQEYLINSPQKLQTLIEKLAIYIEQHIIEEQQESIAYHTPFETIKSAQWPDMIYCTFQCPQCKKQFELFADTYHGGKNNGWHITNK